MTSVNTNASAMTALRTLQQTNKALDATQNRISTGLKIGEAKDNAAYWAISTTLKSDNKSLSTVKDALGLGAATVDTAYQGLNKAKEVLEEIQKKLTAATQDGVDRTIIQNEIAQLQEQLTSIATSSTFSGENWLSVDSSAQGYNAAKQLVSGFTRNASGAVEIGSIDVDTTAMVLYDSATGKSGALDGQVDLGLGYGGNPSAGAVPGDQGLATTVNVDGKNATTALGATVTLGTFAAAGLQTGDRMTFNLALNGATAQAVNVSLGSVTNAATFATALQAGLDATFGSGGVTATNTAGVITLTTGATGITSAITVTGLSAVDGNGVVSSTLGMQATSAFGTGAEATLNLTHAGYTTAIAALNTGDSFKFRFKVDGDVFETAVLSKATTVAGLVTAMKAATRVSDGIALNLTGLNGAASPVEIYDDGADIVVMSKQKGDDKAIELLGVFDFTKDVSGTAVTAGVTTTAEIAALNTSLTAARTVGTSVAAEATLTYSATGLDAGDMMSVAVQLYVPGTVSTDPLTYRLPTAIAANLKTLSFKVGSTAEEQMNNMKAAFDTAFGVGKANFSFTGSTITVKTTALGTGTGIGFGPFSIVDGDTIQSSTVGMSTPAAGTIGVDGVLANTNATATAASAFSGPATFDENDKLTLSVVLDGGTAKTVTIDKATIDSALGGSTGKIADITAFVTVVNQALTNAGFAGTVVASQDTGKLVLTKAATGAATLAVTAVATAGNDTMSVSEIDLTATAFTNRTADERKLALKAYINIVKTAIDKITSAAANIGSVASRIDLQNTFVDTLMDTIDKGVGNLIDADLNEESTRLQALQTKQQLGVQALSIANSGTQNILRLFQ